MATAQQTVLRAYKELGYVDIDTTVATLRTALMDHGIDVLSRMLATLPAHGLSILDADLAMTGNVYSAERTIDGLETPEDLFDTSRLHAGMYVTGTGIAPGAKIARIDSATQVTLDTPSTASGAGVSLTFSDLPLDERFEDAVIAMLAVRLAPSARVPVTEELARAAKAGWRTLQAHFVHVPEASCDPALTNTFVRKVV